MLANKVPTCGRGMASRRHVEVVELRLVVGVRVADRDDQRCGTALHAAGPNVFGLSVAQADPCPGARQLDRRALDAAATCLLDVRKV